QRYKGYFIAASPMSVHPFSPDWYVVGSVLVPGRSSSIVEVTRFQLERFTVSIKQLAEWFGLEVAGIVVDECLPSREKLVPKYPQRSCPISSAPRSTIILLDSVQQRGDAPSTAGNIACFL